MNRVRLAVGAVIAVALVSTVALQADVRMQERTQTKFEGMIGRMSGLFGGKAVKEGIVAMVAVKGPRKARLTETGGEIIDLGEERVYTLDMRSRTYTVQTFAEIRQQFEELAQKSQEQMRKPRTGRQAPEGPQMEVEARAKETGERKTINGFNCRQVIITITAHEKGKTVEQGGGLVLTSDTWLGPRIPAMKEIADFDLRYMKAIQSPAMADAATQMAQAMAMYPGLQQAMTKLQTDKVNMDGTPILTTVTMQSVPNPQQAAEAEEGRPAAGGGLGGLLGRLGRGKPPEGGATPAAADAPKGAATFMTTVTEVLSVTPAASEADVAIPAGFRQK